MKFSRTSCFSTIVPHHLFAELILSVSLKQQAGELVNAEVLESQRTTFVKQLKLGKVYSTCLKFSHLDQQPFLNSDSWLVKD